jgi:hypothetical protein
MKSETEVRTKIAEFFANRHEEPLTAAISVAALKWVVDETMTEREFMAIGGSKL